MQNRPAFPFKIDTPLRSAELYVTAVGLFEQNDDFELVTPVIINGSPDDKYADIYAAKSISEIARVYKNKSTGEHHILYYPAKDNENNTELHEKIDIPLTSLVYEVGQILSRNDWYANAKKHFIICESNTYCKIPVAHYIYANVTKDTLTTDDSINRDYDLKFVTQTFPRKKHKHIPRDWQNMLLDTWQCGHYALLALDRNISQHPLTNVKHTVTIDEKIIEAHNQLYATGSAANIQKSISGDDRKFTHQDVDDLSLDGEGFCDIGGDGNGDEDVVPPNDPDKKDSSFFINPSKNKTLIPLTPPQPSFWERHKAKFIGGGIGTMLGIGLGIGLSIGLAPLTGGGSLVVGGLLIAGLCASSIWLGASAGVGAGVIVENCCQTPSSTASMHRGLGSKPSIDNKRKCEKTNPLHQSQDFKPKTEPSVAITNDSTQQPHNYKKII